MTTFLFDFQRTGWRGGGQRSRWTINPVIELSGDPPGLQPAAGRGLRKKRIHCLEISSLAASKLFITRVLVQGTPTPRQEELLGNKISPAAWLCLGLSTNNLEGVNLPVEGLEFYQDSPVQSL